MHNNYYFLRQLSRSIGQLLQDTVVSECFSQTKEELMLRFEKGRQSHYIKATLLPAFSCLSFPTRFERARKNSVDLFQKVVGQKLTGVKQFENERSFLLSFTDNINLLFKMHGTRANILLYEGDVATELFKNNLPADAQISLATLDRKIDWSYDGFTTHHHDLPKLYFTFGKLIWDYLGSSGFDSKPVDEKWQIIQHLKQQLENPVYHITALKKSPALSLVNYGNVIKTLDDPIQAANEFYYTFTQVFALTQEKAALLSVLQSRLQSSGNYIKKTSAKLNEIASDTNYKVWADLIMANMHAIHPGSEKVTVDNFYNDNHPVEIKLKKELTPQRNAEIFYRKSKNQKIEIEHLEQALHKKQEEIDKLQQQVTAINAAHDLKSLREIKTTLNIDTRPQAEVENLPYHEFVFNGYRIWVGRNAESNDILTLKYGYKEDLWLHAKDVAGSHVLVKHQAGKNFPKDVIERAAQLAAYNSKRKTDTLCPVIVTSKKFVRKRKGDPPGAVVVDREEVILVEPKL